VRTYAPMSDELGQRSILALQPLSASTVGARRLSSGERASLWRLRLRARDALSSSLTLIPSLYLGAAVALGAVMPVVDRARGGGAVLGVNGASAESILESVAAGMIAFAGLVVSVAVLVVQFGAGQYSPRLVQVFRRDPVIKNALGMLIAPGVYALVAAANIGGSSHDRPETLTVVVALALMVIALGALFRFIERLLDLMRPRRLYARLATWADVTTAVPGPAAAVALPVPAAGMAETTVRNGSRGGVLAGVDHARLVRAAQDADAVIELIAQIGSHVAARAPIFAVHGGTGIDGRELQRSLVLADGRRLRQDPSFAIRCIVDVTVRALSAAINDPTSAVEGLDALDLVLRRLGASDQQASAILDDEGAVRLVMPVPDWSELLDLALSEIGWYGAGTPQVTRRLAALLAGLEAELPGERLDAIARHRGLLDRHLDSVYQDPIQRTFAGTPDPLGIGGHHHAGGRSPE
jgi:uncharacterized membrane protein